MDNKRLLIVEDDVTTRTLLQEILKGEGYEVLAVSDAPEALDLLQRQGLPHLVLLDLGLPSMHGAELSERIKRMGDVPIIIITGNRSEEAVVESLSRFAEDYITKPFKVREVIARIERVLSRMPDYSYTQGPLLQIDDHLTIDFANNRIFLEGQCTTLTPIETALLFMLVNHQNRILTADILIRRVWPNKEIYEETLRVHIHRLRSKLEPDRNGPSYLYTERGTGYMFCVPTDENA